jgi:hypothetical protein
VISSDRFSKDARHKEGVWSGSESRETKMLMSRYQKTGQTHSIKIANRSFEDVAKFKYLGITLTDKNCICKEIKSRLNACYH